MSFSPFGKRVFGKELGAKTWERFFDTEVEWRKDNVIQCGEKR